jgi:hypothetical protein
MTFYCLFVAQVLTAYASGRERSFGTWGRAVAIAVAVICIVVPARESRLQQLSLAFESADSLDVACDIALGGEWAAVTAVKRRDAVLRNLSRLGLDAGSCASLLDEDGMVREDRMPPGAFVPPRRFLTR